MKIAISGAQCSGKTTLLNALKKNEFFEKYHFFSSFSNKLIKDENHSENSNISLQLQMLYYSLENMKNQYENELHDRCILDVLIYTKALNQFHNKEIVNLDLFIETFERRFNYFDYIFILNANNIPFVTSSKRSENLEHRKIVNDLFLDYADFYEKISIKSNIIVLNSKNTEDNIHQIMKVLK